MQYWKVLLTSEGDSINTFTWATTEEDARKRVEDMLSDDPEIWEGWSFQLHE